VIILAEKKYYWLKLKEDFFRQPRMKKLRRIAGGDTYTVIYLKLQLLSLENEGMLYFEGIEDDFIEELALTIDEDVDNVKFTVMYLMSQGLMEEKTVNEYVLPEAVKSIGSETANAERKRRSRSP
jgi:predicted phage replisome organizer